jgi:hypothetical protein
VTLFAYDYGFNRKMVSKSDIKFPIESDRE